MLVGLAALIGFAYYRFSGIFRHGPEVVEQIFTLVDEIDDLEELEEIEELEDLEKLEGIEDIEEIEFLDELDDEDIEEIENIGPVVRSIYESIPEVITDMLQEETDEEPAKNLIYTPQN